MRRGMPDVRRSRVSARSRSNTVHGILFPFLRLAPVLAAWSRGNVRARVGVSDPIEPPHVSVDKTATRPAHTGPAYRPAADKGHRRNGLQGTH